MPLGLLVGGGVALLVCLVGGIGLLVWALKGSSRATPVTASDLDRIDIYMTLAEVEAILSKGTESDSGDMLPTLYQAGRQCGVTVWYRWDNGDDSLFVGFGESKKSGTLRAVMSYFRHDIRTANAEGQEYKYGFLHLAAFGGDLDDLALEKKQEKDLLASPRWKKGEAARKALVGRWVAELIGMYYFKDDGTCRTESPGEKAAGPYRFTDDETVELTLTVAPFVEGQQPRNVTRKYKVLVDETELLLIDPRSPRARPTVYKRQK